MYNLNSLAKKINETAHEKGFYDKRESIKRKDEKRLREREMRLR